MNTFTKVLLTVSTMVLGTASFAQKTCDLKITATAAPTTVNYGDTSRITIVLTNIGTATMNTSDTVYYGPVGSTSVFALVPTGNIAAGGSQTFSNVLYIRNSFDTLTADRTLNTCLMLYPQTSITKNGVPVPVTYNDPVATNDSSCFQITFKKKPTSGIFEFGNEAHQLSMYPNPATTDVRFDVNLEKAENITVSVKDMSGRNVLTKDFGKVISGTTVQLGLDVSHLQAGMYLVEVNGEQRIGTGRFVIK